MASMQVSEPYSNRPIQVGEALAYQPGSDSFDFRRTLLSIGRSCRAHWLLIIATCMVTMSIVVTYIVVWPPIYAADVLMVAEGEKDFSRIDFYNNWNVFRKNPLTDEVQLFTAPTVLTRVVDRLNLTYDEIYHPFMSHVTYLWMTSTVGKTYRRVKQWVWPRKRSPYDPTPEQVDHARTIGDFRSGVSVEPAGESNVAKLVVRGPSPRVAEMANTLVQVYLEYRTERYRREAELVYNALAAEVERTRAELSVVESKMVEYYTQNNLLLAMEKDRLDVTQMETLRAAIVEIESQLAGAAQVLVEVNTQLASEPKEILTARVVRISPVREALTDKQAQLELVLKTSLIHYRTDAPEIKDLEKQIAVVRNQLAREPIDQVAQSTLMLNEAYESLRRRKSQIESDMAGQRAALVVKQAEAARLAVVVSAIPHKLKMSHMMERDRHVLEKRYTAMQDKLSSAAVSMAMATSAPASIQIIDDAKSPDEPSWPQTKLFLAAALGIGLLAGVGLALLVDLVSDRVDRHRLEALDGGGDVYAILPPDKRFAERLFPVPVRRGTDSPSIGAA